MTRALMALGLAPVIGGQRHCAYALIAAMLVLWPSSVMARRVALVIGNSVYASTDLPGLPTAAGDARLIGRALLQAGFDQVDIRTDLSQAELREALASFGSEAAGAEEAVIYFAGNGFELSGRNWLLPSDAALRSPAEVSREALPLDVFVAALDRSKGLKVLVVDAAHPLPVIDRWKRSAGYAPKPDEDVQVGLAGLEIADTLVVYAAKAGAVAPNETGPNGRLALSLARRLTEPGVEVRQLFAAVHDDVSRATNGRQEPSVYGTLSGAPAYFVKPTPQTAQKSAEEQAWVQAQQTSTSQSFGDYLQLFPSGRYWTTAIVLQARKRAEEARAGTRVFTGRTIHLKADGTGDFRTLREAIAAAKDGDRIVLQSGAYPSAIPLKISTSILIIGPPRGQGTAILSVTPDIWIAGGSPQLEQLTIQCGCLTVISITGGKPILKGVTLKALATSAYPTPTALQVSGATVLTLVDSDVESPGFAMDINGGTIAAVRNKFAMSGATNRAVINATMGGRSAFVDNAIVGIGTTFFGFNTGPIVFEGNQIQLSGVPNERFGLITVLNQASPVIITRNRVSLGAGDGRWAGCLIPTQCPVKIESNVGLRSSEPYIEAAR